MVRMARSRAQIQSLGQLRLGMRSRVLHGGEASHQGSVGPVVAALLEENPLC